MEEPKHLTEKSLFEEKHWLAIRAVVEELKNAGENPAEFFATVEEEGKKTLVFHLLHSKALALWKENPRIRGNPGGKCRDVYFDTEKKKVVETLFWQ